VTRRFSHGLQFLAAYTFSKSMDDTSGGSTTLFSTLVGNQADLGANKALSDFDRPSRLTLSLTYEIPRWGFGWNNSVFGKKFFSGWMVSTVGLVQTGLPFSVTDSTGAAFYGVTSSTASWAPGATISTAELSGQTESRLNEYFDTAAFVKAGNYFGTAARNVLRGPSQGNIDLALSKRTAIGDRLQVDFRGEFFNAMNTPNFTSPNGSITSSSFGEVTSITRNPPVVQFALKLMF
jgi:hypothetical protein